MAEDWAADVKKYASNADDKAIAGIVRYCGIALQKRDSSLVSFSDKAEVARVSIEPSMEYRKRVLLSRQATGEWP